VRRPAAGSSRAAEDDINATVAYLLRDLAGVQPSQHQKWGYKRAAAAVLNLDEPLTTLLRPDGTFGKILHVGPSSTRVILEALQTGASPLVEKAIDASGRRKDVERARTLRRNFLSRARVVATLRDRTLDGPNAEDYRGDLQLHSVWSDGSDTLASLVKEAVRRQYEYLAVTDHSHGLPIARGMSQEATGRQHQEIDRLNRRHGDRFRLLKGVEANILADGQLDLTAEELKGFELVVAAPHSKLRVAEDQTARMLAAVATPGVHVLGHPRGRMAGSRAGVQADWPRVFRAAAARRVAIEIDGDPARQDIDFDLARQALDAGCLFALDSDAHSGAELRYSETAIAHARLAAIPSSRIVNCWKVDRLLEWADERKASERRVERLEHSF